MHLYLKDDHRQRTIILCTSPEDESTGTPSRALVFRTMEGDTSKVMVEFLPRKELDLSIAVRLTTRKIKGCLGLINIGDGELAVISLFSLECSEYTAETFIAVVLSSMDIGNMRPSAVAPESAARIHDVGFFSLNSSTWDTMSTAGDPMSVGATSPEDYSGYVQSNAQQVYEHPCAPLMKILSSGTFYYALSPTWDISSRLSRRVTRGKEYGSDALVYDDRFLWNEYIIRNLLDFREKLDPEEKREMDLCQFIVSGSRTVACRLIV